MRKQHFCICENKGTDQRLCFRYMDSSTFLEDSTFYIQNFQSVDIFCACTARFVSNLFGNHIVGFLMTLLISAKIFLAWTISLVLYPCLLNPFSNLMKYLDDKKKVSNFSEHVYVHVYHTLPY